MVRRKEPLSRRELIKSFGISAFILHPVLRSMAYAAETPFDRAPRYIHFFKGGSFYPSRTSPPSVDQLAGTPIAPLTPHAKDIVLFKGMSIHGGSPKSIGYKEQHAAGVFGCATGNVYKYSQNDAYFAYTDNESIDVRIAEHYKTRPDLADVPMASLHIGGGAHSDADQVGVGNRFISFRNRKPGDTRYGNAIEPIQDAGQVYDTLMRSAAAVCTAASNQPRSQTNKMRAALADNVSVADFMVDDIEDAKRRFSVDSEHARKLDAMLDNWHETQKAVHRQASASNAPPAAVHSANCTPMVRPTGNGANKYSLDVLSPVHDQMISLIKLAFETDITRVVAFTLSGASSGQSWPSHGIHEAHHQLEHAGNVDKLVKIDTYYSEKFAALLEALKSIEDPNGKTALYNSAVFLGMECWSNSSSGHYLTNIPFVLAGQAGGHFQTGRIVDAHGRSNNDIHISCLNAAGIDTKTFGLPELCTGPIV